MLTIIIRALRDRKWTIAIYCLASVLFLWMYIALFPTIKDSFADLQKMLHAMPQGMLEAFGFEISSFGTFEGYIGSEQFTLVWPIMIIALACSFAGQSLAGEVERGTAEILLSQPISRIKIFAAKYISGVVAIAIFIFVSIGSVFPIAMIHNISFKSANFVLFGLLGFCFAITIYSLAIFFSAVFSEKGKANFVPVGLLILSYVVNIISTLQANLENFKYTSIFYYFTPSKVLVYGQIDNLSWLIFIGSSLLLTLTALSIFNKKDISR